MNRKLLLLLCGVLILGPAGISSADSLTFNLDFEYSGGAQPAGSKPWLSTTFSDFKTGVFNTVQLTMTAGGLSGSEFISHWFFNTSFENTLVFSYQKDLSTAAPIPSDPPKFVNPLYEEDDIAGGGAKGFDIDFAFETTNSAKVSRFEAKETVVYFIEGLGLKAIDFAAVNAGGEGYYSAAHVQGIGVKDDSGWIASNAIGSPPVPDPIPIPEPATMILLGLGLIGVAVIGRRVH